MPMSLKTRAGYAKLRQRDIGLNAVYTRIQIPSMRFYGREGCYSILIGEAGGMFGYFVARFGIA